MTPVCPAAPHIHILGACILLGQIAIGDWLTALIAATVAALFRWNLNNPRIIAAVVGLIAFLLLQPTWVMVKSGLQNIRRST